MTPEPGQELLYKVRRGQTLWTIASEMYGDGDLWGDLGQVNHHEVRRRRVRVAPCGVQHTGGVGRPLVAVDADFVFGEVRELAFAGEQPAAQPLLGAHAEQRGASEEVEPPRLVEPGSAGAQKRAAQRGERRTPLA